MSTEASEPKGTCFVVMGFGKKTDFETGRTLDLDKSYRNMIKPAVEAAGLQCIRADEIVHSGLIDVPMYQQLLNADVVVADLSTSNKNAFYELGVRHALRPYTTVVIAEDGIKTFPFDVNHVVVRQYHHLGEDIGFDEVMRFRGLLTAAIKEVWKKNPRDNDSPVYTFLNGLTPPAIAVAKKDTSSLGNSDGASVLSLSAAVQSAALRESTPAATTAMADKTHSMLMQQVDQAQKNGDFIAAKNFLSFVRGMMKQEAPDRPEDPYIIQRLALVTYKSKSPSEQEALNEARELLATLDPATSNDTETLGLWGAVHKRRWDLTGEKSNLDEAVRGYERGFFLRNDYYNGINLAYMLNVRGRVAGADPAEAIADFVQAQRVRKEVLEICERWLVDNPDPAQGANMKSEQQHQQSKYWVLATMAEAYFGLGDETAGAEWLARADAVAPFDWMKKTTQDQIAKLKALLADSPLKRIT
jgi:tetratricopeptide (TPR) repeat protein